MNIRTFCSIVAVLSVTASAASAQGLYVSVLGGSSRYPSLSYDGGKAAIHTGENEGLRIGYGLDEWMPLSGFSLEADLFYNQSQLRGQTQARFDSVSAMGNLIYHMNTGWPLGLYGGGGIGSIRTDVHDPLSNRTSTVLGWQGLGGVDFPITPAVKLFAEYRYQNAHDANLRFIGGPVGNTSNNVSLGIQVGL